MKPVKNRKHEKGLVLISRVETESLQMIEEENGESCCSAEAAPVGVDRLPMLGLHTRTLQEDERKVLLIAPHKQTEAPMTLAMLGSIFEDEGFSAHGAVNTFKNTLHVADYVDMIRAKNIHIVAVSMLTIRVLDVYEIISAARQEGCIIIAGGAHPTDQANEVIENGADIVVRGEGEDTLREICKYWKGQDGIKLENIRGVTYRNKKGDIVSTERRGRVDLSKLPLQNLDIFDEKLFRQDDDLVKGFHRTYTSRGCPGSCTFCDWMIFGQALNLFPLETIIDDMKRRLDNYGITTFTVADDCFTVDADRVIEFCNMVVKEFDGHKYPKIRWRANSRANLVVGKKARMLQPMVEAGCFAMAFGLESGDPDTLKRIRKGIKLEHNIEGPKNAAAAGLEVYGCMMSGYPWETPAHIENSIKLIHELWDDVFLFQVSGCLVPFPGTEIYRSYYKDNDFENFWLREGFQDCGIQTYQNHENPYSVSTFYQRHLFDDQYIQEDYFFDYDPAYKTKLKELVYAIGKHNLVNMFPNKFQREKTWLLSRASRALYEWSPTLERRVGGFLYDMKSKLFERGSRSGIENLRDKRRGIVKNRDGKEVSLEQRGMQYSRVLQELEENSAEQVCS